MGRVLKLVVTKLTLLIDIIIIINVTKAQFINANMFVLFPT